MKADDQESLMDKIIGIKDKLPKKQRKLCDFLLKNYQSIGLMTIKELADEAEVGISTVLRTINALGYESFNDLRKDMYEESLPAVSKWTLKKSFTEDSQEVEKEPTLVQVWNESVNLLNKSLNTDLMESFEQAVDLIIQSGQISILGTRPYKATALYFEQLLGEFYPRIRQLSHDTETMFDRILQFEQDEILVVFAFEPYTNRVIEAVKLIHALGNQIILITDHASCPVISYASVTLKVQVSDEQFSIIPIMALIDALVIEIGKQTSEQSIDKLKRLEKILKDNHVTFSY